MAVLYPTTQSPVLFIRHDGTWTTAMFLLVACLPLGLAVSASWAVTALIGAMILATCNAVQEITDEDKLEIRYNILHPDHIVQEMVDCEASVRKEKQDNQDKGSTLQLSKARLVVETGMTALVKQYTKRQRQKQLSPDADGEPNHHLALLCQEAAYIALRLFTNDTAIVASALSLLSLVAKTVEVRDRHCSDSNYTIELPIRSMRESLRQAQTVQSSSSNTIDEAAEQQVAELQRKGCLLLGALSDGNEQLARQIVQNGGMEAAIDAMNWFAIMPRLSTGVFGLSFSYAMKIQNTSASL
jgi:hypothetical protein